MNIQIFGTLKCNDTKKARRFFQERNIQVHFRDLTEKGLAQGELNNIAAVIPLEEIVDTEGKQFAKRNLKFMKYNLEEELLSDPLLLKTPIVRNGRKVTIGVQTDIWSQWIKEK